MTNAVLANKLISSLLDKSLAKSTWRDHNPKAYDELLYYRRDMENDIVKCLERLQNAALNRSLKAGEKR